MPDEISRHNPFQIEAPALISFSGGRTSGFMLRRILDEGLEEGVHVVFADTGKERRETYSFVHEVALRWNVPIAWVHREGYFDKLIEDKQIPPNTIMRFCTEKLKLKPMWDYGKSLGFDHWTACVGIRADEPRRVAKIRGRKPMAFEDVYLPLAVAGISLEDVTAFWKRQPFDLQLQPHEGNCDLCFLKGQQKRIRIMQDHPELARWWIQQEEKTGGFFRLPPRPSYADLLQIASHPRLFDPDAAEIDDLVDCACTD